MRPQSIDDVLAALDAVIDRAFIERDRLGFFAALYRTVTAEVKRGIASGRFEDGARMERLDVLFANRYLDALDGYRRGGAISHCWRAAFDAARDGHAVILQHLLLGMNAHINLDLGIAAAELCPGDALAGLRHDFDEINILLATMETTVERELCTLSPWIDRLDHIDPKRGRVAANFSIERARACSWNVAVRLAKIDAADRTLAIDEIDREIALLASLIRRPVGLLLNLNVWLVWLRETKNVRRTLRVLSGTR